MRIMSLFDGMSCGQIALNRLGIDYDDYFASEIDKFPISVTQRNYPKTIQIGDVTKIQTDQYSSIDLLIGGSPCQGFSFAGKQLNFDDPRSKLFFDFIRIKNEIRPKYFLLENVLMQKKFQDVITEQLGVEPIFINSNLVSAQNRKRLYWTNIPVLGLPKDKKIKWRDIREFGVKWSNVYYSDAGLNWIKNHGQRKNKQLKIYEDDDKFACLEASHSKSYSSQRFFGIIDEPTEYPSAIVGRKIDRFGKRNDKNANLKPTQCLEVRGGHKMPCLSTVNKDCLVSILPMGSYHDVFKTLEKGKHYRYITSIEAERLQTVPDNYTAGVSKSQRYKMLGNGWTIDVIAFIFSFLPKDITGLDLTPEFDKFPFKYSDNDFF